MDFIAQLDWLYTLAGFAVGVMVGFTGVGGGALMTPLLVLVFGVAPQTAVGTDLIYAATTKTAGSAVHGWRETVDWKIVRRLASGSLPAAFVTLLALHLFGEAASVVQTVIVYLLGVMLLITAVAVAFQTSIIRWAANRHPVREGRELLPTVVLGAVIGTAVSLSSVGAGAIGVTALLMLYPSLPMARIVGTDIAHAVPLAFVSGLGHWAVGGVDTGLLMNLLVGSIPGVILGSLLATHVPDRLLRPALALVLLVSGFKLLS
ncbi:MAG: sulfite exporter TauE/SafE family protein [Novosphingobium sp.]